MITPKFYTWLKCACVRALRTIAQTALASLGTSATFGEVNWKHLISVSLFAGLLSLLTSVVTGLPEVEQKEQLDSIKQARELNGQ